ncbi:serine/threonine protein kinase, putative [Plasmodium gallinaceum]|uniref:Serine/threonine protein kinase, putative n=1 Tax=Plasmodium gallinaceum TaxID=5849 RepID=A0A1J1GVG1_PLAGA|nr:serine/threonine protein kinase, putative [Plasmodium gallinaceum]CRG96529.1 serine/threonine protein kinase, putative [Plasmodium gallinaceum]
MMDDNEVNVSKTFLKQRIKKVKSILIRENEMPKIDQIFKYELKINYPEVTDLLHYINGIIYKNVDKFKKLSLLYSYDDNNDYSTSNIKQNTFVFLLKQKIKFREKYKNENYTDYLRTNPLIFIDTLNKLLIIPGIGFEFKLYNFDEKNNKYFLKKTEIKINSLYNPCFIRLKNDNFKNIIKFNKKTEKNDKKNEHHIEHYFIKRNSVDTSKKLKTDFVSKEKNNSEVEINIKDEESCNNKINCKNEVNYNNEVNDNCEEKYNDKINDKSHIDDNNTVKLEYKKERRKRKSFNTYNSSECNNSKKNKNNFSNNMKKKYNQNTSSKDVREEDENSLNHNILNNKSMQFFYDLINEYEIYINNVKCYIIFDLKSYYKNLDIMKKLKKNLEELKKPNNVFKEIIEKKTFKSSRDKIEFIKRFKKMIIPNFRIEKIRKQRNHLIIVELMSKIQNSLIIKRLHQELSNKVNLEDLINSILKKFLKSIENIKEESVKKFYLDMVSTYFYNKNLSVIDFKNLIQIFKKKEEQQKNQEFYNLFQNDLNYLEKNKKDCDEIEEKINSLKGLILESILKEKQLERSVNRLLLNHEQSKYGYFYKIEQTDENNLDTTEYGKLLENFSKEPINFYSILNKRNLDRHAYHDIRNFNYKKKISEKLKPDISFSRNNQISERNKISSDKCKYILGNNEGYNTIDKSKKNIYLNSINDENPNNSYIIKNSLQYIYVKNKKFDNESQQGEKNKINLNEKEESSKDNKKYNEYNKCKIEKINYEVKNDEKENKCVKYNKQENKYYKKKIHCKLMEFKNKLNSVSTNSNEIYKLNENENCKKVVKNVTKNYVNKYGKKYTFKKSNNCESKKQTSDKEKHRYEVEEFLSDNESEQESDIIRSICEKKNLVFINEKQEKINNEIFYKVFEQYPYSFFSKSVKNYNLILNENEEEAELSWLTMLKKKNHKRSILPPSRDTFRDGTHFSNCRATEHTLKFFLSLLSLLTKSEVDINLKKYLKKNIQFLNTELFSMKLNLDKKRAILEKRLDHFNFQENSEFSFYNPLKINIRMMNLIGRGGFAEVWEVFDSINLEMYAAKIHKIEPSMSNEIKNKIIQRAENEINIHIHCHRHIFIVKLEFFFVFGSATNLLVGMELCDIDLDKYIKYHGPINEILALSWIKQILLGLLYMKNLPTGKVHHCDLKPANLLIKDGIIKISDFGLAKLILPDTCQYYNGGGTLYYQPPECLKNKKNLLITDKIDIWSLGCILYEMLFCERAFQFNYLEKCSKELLVNKMKKGLTYPKINQKISDITLNYIQYLLNFDYEFRPSIEEALSYPIFNYFNIP